MDHAEYYNQLIKQFNESAMKGDYEECTKLINSYAMYIKEKAGCPNREFDLNLTENIPDGTVCVLAHSRSAKRSIGIIYKDEEKTHAPEASPVAFKYIFRTLVIKKPKAGPGVSYTVSNKGPLTLITYRRGFWLIWRKSLGAKITMSNIQRNAATVDRWYNEIVKGMHQAPPINVQRNSQDWGFEQFMLLKYPTPEWRLSVNGFEKKNKRTSKQERIERAQKKAMEIALRASAPVSRKRKQRTKALLVEKAATVVKSGDVKGGDSNPAIPYINIEEIYASKFPKMISTADDEEEIALC